MKRRRTRRGLKLPPVIFPPRLEYRTFECPESLNDQQVMESWVALLRRRAEDAYYRRSTWEALATVVIGLIVAILLCLGLARLG